MSLYLAISTSSGSGFRNQGVESPPGAPGRTERKYVIYFFWEFQQHIVKIILGTCASMEGVLVDEGLFYESDAAIVCGRWVQLEQSAKVCTDSNTEHQCL